MESMVVDSQKYSDAGRGAQVAVNSLCIHFTLPSPSNMDKVLLSHSGTAMVNNMRILCIVMPAFNQRPPTWQTCAAYEIAYSERAYVIVLA